MKFNNIDEAMEYFKLIAGDKFHELDITIAKINESAAPIEAVVEQPFIKLEESIRIETLSDSPLVMAGVDNELQHNVLFVEGYESIPFACSTGQVTFMGRKIFTNICEDEHGPTIYLNITLKEKFHQNVPFKLKSSADKKSDYIMLLNPKILAANE